MTTDIPRRVTIKSMPVTSRYHLRGYPWREQRYSVEDHVARTMRRRARAAGRHVDR